MNDQQIQALWNQSRQKEPKMDAKTIDLMLDKSVRHGWRGLRSSVWVFTGLLGVAGVFNLLNIVEFASLPGWLVAFSGLGLLILGAMVFSFRVLRELRSMDDPGESLSILVRRQLSFFHRTFEGWLWVAAATGWMLSLTITIWMENQENGYRINHVFEFVAISLALIFGSYAIMRLVHYPMIQRTLAALQDLESQLAERTERLNAQRKYWLIGGVLLVIALTFSVLWRIKVWLSAGP